MVNIFKELLITLKNDIKEFASLLLMLCFHQDFVEELPPPPAMMEVNAEELASASTVMSTPSPRTTSRRATPKGSFHNDILISNGTEHGLTLLPPNHMSKVKQRNR
ncbi:hypothetical protein SESBI_46398 [Sesbania bispinosa]|nr:hypothetical protein SESBI_46398 [Sesbania bispinosa]